MIKLDWSSLMLAGIGGLGLAPDAFWRLTPVELQLMLGLPMAQGAMNRDRLEQLLAAYPDETQGERDE